MTVYEPREGWYETDIPRWGTYRVVDADGALSLDAETGVLVDVDISYTGVEAETYLEYYRSVWQSNDVHSKRYTGTYQVNESVEQPTWVVEPN